LYLVNDEGAFSIDDDQSISGWSLIFTLNPAATSTTTTLSSNINPSFTSGANSSVTLTATVTGTSTVNTGTVTFKNGSNTITCSGGNQTVSNGQATCVTTFTTQGNYSLTADYSGGGSFVASNSPTLNQFVETPTTGSFCNAGGITMPGQDDTQPYPSVINVTGVSNAVATVSLTLTGFSWSPSANAVHLLLVSPSNQALEFFAATTDASLGNYTFTDTGTLITETDEENAISPGTYQPAVYTVPPPPEDVFTPQPPLPAPQVPSSFNVAAPRGNPTPGTFENTFNGATSNGAWSLFVYDDAGTNASGSITGGWCLDITQASGAATTTTVTSAPNPALAGVSITVTATVKSGGNPVTEGTVTFTENGQNVAGGPTSPVAVNGSGQASFSTTSLPEGDHNILATYNGVVSTYALSFGNKIQRVDNATTSSTASGVISYCNPGTITIPSTSNPTDEGQASPNPSNIFVANAPGTINHVTVTLKGVELSTPYYLTSLLVGPLNTTADSLDFFSDVGGSTPMTSPVNVTLDDNASSSLSTGAAGSALATGTFKPTSGKGGDTFFASSDGFYTPPSSPYPYAAPIGSSTLDGNYENQNPNGTWSLYLNQVNQSTNSSMSYWCVNLTENPPVLAITKTHNGDFTQGQTGAQYTVVVTNNGPGSTGGTVTVTEVPPTGLTVTGMSGNNWSCSGSTCTRSDALPEGGSYDPITVTVSVASNAPASLTNAASVSGGGTASTVTATDQTTINPAIVAPTIAVTNVSPSSEVYGQDSQVTITAVLSWTGTGPAPTASDVTIGGDGLSSYSATTCTAPSGDTMTCSATYTPSALDVVGTYTETASFTGDNNYLAASSTQSNNFGITQASTSTSVGSGQNPSITGQTVTFTATIDGQYGEITRRKGASLGGGSSKTSLNRRRLAGNGAAHPLSPVGGINGSVTWSANTGCGTTPVSGEPGTAQCTTSTLPQGTDTITANYSGDNNHSGSLGTLSGGQVVNPAVEPTAIVVTSVSPSSEAYGQDAGATITAVLSWTGTGPAPTASDVSITTTAVGGTLGATSCGTPGGNTMTCTATFTPDASTMPGPYTMLAGFSGDSNYSASSSTQSDNFTITQATSSTSLSLTGGTNPSAYGTSVTFSATIQGEYGMAKTGKGLSRRVRANPETAGHFVTWSANTGCSQSPVPSLPATVTCTTSALPTGPNTVVATYSGDIDHTGSSNTIGQTVSQQTPSINVTNVSPSSEVYGQNLQVTITAALSWTGSGTPPTVSDVSISTNAPGGTLGATSCGTPTSDSLTCTATFTPNAGTFDGTYTMSASFSGDNDYGTASSAQTNNFSITEATSGTATSLTSGTNPSTYGSSVMFTATITGEYGEIKSRNGALGQKGRAHPLIPSSQTVTWSANTGCSSSPVTSLPATVTCTTSVLPAGADTVTATYSGDSNHSGSSGSVGQNVSQQTPTIVVTNVSPSSEVYGQDAQVTITAVLSWTGSGTAPTASDVSISTNAPGGTLGTTSCGSPSSDSLTCTATFTPNASTVDGTYTMSASFSGDSNYNGSSSTQSNNFSITQATSGTSTSLTSGTNPSTYGSSVMFMATITGEYGEIKTRNGALGQKGRAHPLVTASTLTWSANTGCSSSPVTSLPANVTCTTSVLAAGPGTVTATYSGDNNHSGSSGSVGQNVSRQTPSINVTQVSPSSEAYGQDTQVTITAVLSWTGNGNPPTASDVSISTNAPGGTLGTTSCGSPSSDSLTCTATFTPNASTVDGTYTMSASFSGDNNYGTASSAQTNNFSITQATSGTSTKLTSGTNPSTYGSSVMFTATVTGEYGMAKTRKGRRAGPEGVTGGSVTWSANTGCGSGSVASLPATVTCTTSVLPAGADTVLATYSGDSNHSGSSGSVGQNVSQQTSTINVTNVSPSSEIYGQDLQVTITAVLSWTGSGTPPTASAVIISGNAPSSTYGTTSCGLPTTNSLNCTNTYTPTAADVTGTYTMSASFSGDNNYSSSSSAQTNNFSISGATSSTSVISNLNPSLVGQSVAFAATIDGEYGLIKVRNGAMPVVGVKQRGMQPLSPTGGSVTWSANTGCSASPVTSLPATVTCTTSTLPTGNDTITASYSGDGNHSGSMGTLNGGQVVNQAPAITSGNSVNFQTTVGGSFTVTTTGFPTPSISEAGTLPGGVTFVDNHNGTGTLSGTPTAVERSTSASRRRMAWARTQSRISR
jgi:large repetitive protein